MTYYRKIETYFIDPKRGIYYTENSYNDHVDYHYVVDFNEPEVGTQFRSFLKRVEQDGADKGMIELRRQFSGLRNLFS